MSTSSQRVLVTGGAGYIGSHAVRALLDSGRQVTVLDDLSTGHREAIDARATFCQASLFDASKVREALADCDAVLHFAASSIVSHSCANPLPYWHNNVGGSVSLLQAMEDTGVSRLIFSSTAATYGIPDEMPIVETTSQCPINPYGQTKLAIERAIADYASSEPGFGYTILRYFNVAGCSWGLGEDHDPETHLIPIILQAAAGKRNGVSIFGTDYPTPDGTCVRDYVHVRDLVEAHVAVLDALEPGTRSTYNIGSGTGWSVRQVMTVARDITGVDFPIAEGKRRPGDPAELVTDPSMILTRLGWKTKRSDIRQILADHWAWVQSHPEGWHS